MVFKFRTISFSGSPLDDVHPTVDTNTQFKIFSLDEICVATRQFSNRNFLGCGAFGSVYKGRLADGTLVAVKRSWKLSDDTEKQILREIVVGGLVQEHPNLLKLRGCCIADNERLLVYPLMVNRSLDYYLKPNAVQHLDWPTRMRIALGVARGLAHLHDQCHPSVIHRDVSSHNVLLDVDYQPVLGDFGLARIMHEWDVVVGNIVWSGDNASNSSRHYEDTYVNTYVRSHMSLIAPEYMTTGKCTYRSDVYAYGNMLVEVISGKQVDDLARPAGQHPICIHLLAHRMNESVAKNGLESVVDPKLQGNYSKDEVERLIHLAMLCTSANPAKRPKMSEVVAALEDLVLRCDNPQRSLIPPEV